MVGYETLDRVPFLSRLKENARRELAARGVLRRFEAGEPLWRMGAEPRGLFVVLEGEVRVVRGTGERQHVLHTEGPGGTLGEVPFFEDGTYPATAVATDPTLCLALSRDAIAAAVREDPELAFELLRRLSARLRVVVERLDRHVAKSVSARLAAHVLARARACPGEPFTLGGTQLQVAEEIGTVREVVVRTLRAFRDQGMVRAAGRGRYRLVDAQALERLAGAS